MSRKKQTQKSPAATKGRQAIVNQALANPFQLTWPVIDDSVIQDAIKLLKSSFADVSLSKSKVSKADKRKIRSAKKRSIHGNESVEPKVTLCAKRPLADKDASNQAIKTIKLHHNDSEDGRMEESCDKIPSKVDNDIHDTADNNKDQMKHSNIKNMSLKKNQFVLGCNSITRCLEQNTLRCGMVCLSARPAFVTQHVMMLSAVRSCPIIPLPNLSQELASLLGIKSAMVVGFKKIPEDIVDHFSDVVCFIITNTPLLASPFVRQPTMITEETADEGSNTNSSCYVPLKMKVMSKPIQQ